MDRREFVQTMAGAGLAIACTGVSRTPRVARLDKVGIQLYTVRDQMKADFEGTLAHVAEIGYKEVEFAGYFNHSAAEVRAILDRHGLASPSTHIALGEIDQWQTALDTAKAVGHEYIVVPWIPEEKRKTLADWKKVADVFNRAAQMAKDAGLQFAYHNHDFEFPKVEGQVPYDVLLQSTDPGLVQLEIDLYWITKGGQDPLSYFARWPGRVPLVHVKDSAGAPEHKMVDVGQGKIDWKRIFAKRDQAGIKHFFVEHDQPPQPFEDIAASYRYLSQLEF
ncbi:MAG TPA: sugar phosphate isomerase/epimerase [Gemmatimonadales bacterium]|jgi:sugar phosphate isomerase/epimerase|nr:sugar phosphate isomerase/epimerase [Gemmatimonadales bacterium]